MAGELAVLNVRKRLTGNPVSLFLVNIEFPVTPFYLPYSALKKIHIKGKLSRQVFINSFLRPDFIFPYMGNRNVFQVLIKNNSLHIIIPLQPY